MKWNDKNFDLPEPDAGTLSKSSSCSGIHEPLEPLISHIKTYDSMRLRLEKQGGRLTDLKTITGTLKKVVTIKGDSEKHKVSLTDQNSIKDLLYDFGNKDLHIQVRQLYNGLPVYYLCRICRDYWSEYSLIVEDLYMSPGYPSNDNRFVRLMSSGHDTYHLRLSQYRESVREMIGIDVTEVEQTVDEILYNLGRHVFQAAWHEDQRLGLLAATHFGMPGFRHAIELLYLCLSGELCELRSVIREEMLDFFDRVYQQPAIHSFLRMLVNIDGGRLNNLAEKALELYARLLKEFSRFLAIEATWGWRQVRVPIYKLIFSNLSRLDLVEKNLKKNDQVIEAVARLETVSQAIINEIIIGSK